MRLVTIGTSLLCLSAVLATAQAAPNNPLIVWQGGVTAVAVTAPACNGVFAIGNLGTGVFRPRLDPAEPASALSVLFLRSAAIYVRTGGPGTDKMHGQGTYRGTTINERAGVKEGFSGAFNFFVSPTNPVPNTAFVSIEGTIGNFFGVTGCTITIRGSFARRP